MSLLRHALSNTPTCLETRPRWRRDTPASNFNCESPNKKQRNTYETLTPRYLYGHDYPMPLLNIPPHGGSTEQSESLTPPYQSDDCFLKLLDCPPQSLEKNFEEAWASQRKNIVPMEVPLYTEFERGVNWLNRIGQNVMGSLERTQQWYRQDTNKIAKARSKELLERDWECSKSLILNYFKNALRCCNCRDIHLEGEFTMKYNSLKMTLDGICPTTVNQAMLDLIREKACEMGGEHLLDVKRSRCQGTKMVWREKVVDEKYSCDRTNSVVGLTNELEGIKME